MEQHSEDSRYPYLEIRTVTGVDLAPYIEDIARLRITVFRDFPYLYDGTPEYEEKYLQTYLQSINSVTVLALDGARVVGASTGLPLAEETAEFQQPLIKRGLDPFHIFYCGESVLLKEYRGRGIYRQFFLGRERHAADLGNFHLCTFCCVKRSMDHPLRPTSYVPMNEIWRRFGYEEEPSLQTSFSWKDIDRPVETAKPMVFWFKSIGASAVFEDFIQTS